MESVVLKPQQLNLYRNSDLEPQYVTKREPNRAIIYIESIDNQALQKNVLSMLSSTVRQAGENPSTLAYGITRISVNNFGLRFSIPNINPRNNVITFFSSVSGTTHTVTLTEGYYTTGSAVITEIVTKLNTVTGASGLTFSFVGNTLFPDRFELNSAGGNYRFDLNCSAVKKGYTMYSLSHDQTLNNSKLIGPIGLFYTTYVDLCSAQLTKYIKLKNCATSLNNNIVLRIHLTEPTIYNKILFITESTAPDIQFSYNPVEPILSIDFQIRDQYGELLYVPQNADGTYQGFWWNTGIIIEC